MFTFGCAADVINALEWQHNSHRFLNTMLYDELNCLNQKFMSDIKIVTNVSQGIFSIARHYGGCKIWGYEFKYYPKADVLIRKDVVPKYNKAMKAGLSLSEFQKQLIV